MSVERGVPAGTSAVTVALGDDDELGAGSHQSHPRRRARQRRRRTSGRRGVATDEWLGIDNTVMLVMGPEHRRFLVDAGWSKDDARNYLFPLPQGGRTAGAHRQARGHPASSAAGGPGMSETWVLFPHLAWAITEPVVPEVARDAEPEVTHEPDRTRSHQRPDARVVAR